MTPLEAAQSRHFLTERHKGFRLCAACLMSWPCDFQVQREEAFRVQALAEGLAEALDLMMRGVLSKDVARAALAAFEDAA